MESRRVRVAVNGYGVIGKRIADAVALQDDMELVGVADVVTNYRMRVAVERGLSRLRRDRRGARRRVGGRNPRGWHPR